MTESFQTLNIKDLRSMLSAEHESSLGDDLFISEIGYDSIERSREILNILNFPVRFDGYLAFFCIEGEFSVDINLHTCHVRPNTLLINIPGNIIRLNVMDGGHRGMRFVIVWLSPEFMSGIRFDFNKLFRDSMSILDNPCITLNERQFRIARQYFVLSTDILGSRIDNKKEAISSLVSSLFYVMGTVWMDSLTEARNIPSGASSARLKMIFDRFLNLVTEYHTVERNMAFYADKLCLTPKYLSKLIKQVSGRSAPAWIDAFVILEAKNMLKYSDGTIKEIVYRLHFPNQSVFYKFFKAHTGLTPSEYRNG